MIGDISFPDAMAEAHLRDQLGDGWEQEHYWLADETLAATASAGINGRYIQISSCAGVFQFSLSTKIEGVL